MEIKLIGYLLLLLCPTAAGFMLSRDTGEELARLEGAIRMAEHIKYEINRRMSTQEEIFARFDNESLEKCGFLPFARACRVENEKSVLTAALEHCGKLLPSFPSAEQALRDFGETLGTLPRAAQEQSCDACISRLSELYAAEKEKSIGKIKLYRSMGMLIGFAAVLLFL